MEISGWGNGVESTTVLTSNNSSVLVGRVMVVGSSGVGKSSLVHHFLSPDYVYTYESNRASVPEPSVCIMLEDRETELVFLDINSEEAQVLNRLLDVPQFMSRTRREAGRAADGQSATVSSLSSASLTRALSERLKPCFKPSGSPVISTQRLSLLSGTRLTLSGTARFQLMVSFRECQTRSCQM